MRARALPIPTVFAYTVTVIVAGLGVREAWLVLLEGRRDPGLSVPGGILWVVAPVAFAALGAFVVHRRPGNRIGWLLMCPAVAVMDMAPSLPSQPPDHVTLGLVLQLWYDNLAWLFLIFPVILTLALFPTGRPVNDRWRWHTRLVLGMGAFLVCWAILAERLGPVDGTWQVDNPLGVLPGAGSDSLGWFMPIWSIGLLAVTVGAVVSMVVRFRRARSVERQQIKWMLYAVVIFAAAYAPTVLLASWVEGGWLLDLAVPLGLIFIPAAMTIAIVRHHVMDIDVVVRRTLVYGVVTAALLGVYAAGVLGVGALLPGEPSDLLVAGSTLAVAALFRPLRARIQQLVDRRFNRSRYDAARTLEAFAARLRDELDLATACDELRGVVASTIQPVRVSVWLQSGAAG